MTATASSNSKKLPQSENANFATSNCSTSKTIINDAKAVASNVITTKNFFDDVKYAPSVNRKTDAFHQFPKLVDAEASGGKVTTIVGNDGKQYFKLEVPVL